MASARLGRAAALIAAASLAMFALVSSAGAAGTFVPAPQRVDAAFDPARGVLYISSGDGILRWDVATESFLTSVPIGGDNRGVALSSDGATLAVGTVASGATPAGLTLVNTSDLSTVTVSDQGPAHTVAWATDQSVFFAPRSASNWIYRYRADLGSAPMPWLSNINEPWIASSADGNVLAWVQGGIGGRVGRFRLSDGALIKGWAGDPATNMSNWDVSVSRDGTQILVVCHKGTVVYDGDLVDTGKRIGAGAVAECLGVAHHPTQDLIFAAWANGRVKVIDSRTLAVIDEIPFESFDTWPGHYRSGHLRISPTGDRVFALVPGGIRYSSVGSYVAGRVSAGIGRAAAVGVTAEVYRLVAGDWSLAATRQVDASGTWSYASPTTDTVKVRFVDPAGLYASQWYGGDSLAGAAEVRPGANDALGVTAQLGLLKPSAIHGRVRGADDNAAISGVVVSLYGADRSLIATAATAVDGEYSFPGLSHAAAYRLGFADAGGRYLPSYYAGATSLAGATDVTLTAGATRDLGASLLTPLPYFKGTVRNALTGAPMPGVLVRIYDWETEWFEGTGVPLSQTVTGPDGTYRIGGAVAGRYHVIAFCDPSGAYRDMTWPQSGFHVGDSMGWRPRPEAGAPSAADAYLMPLVSLKASRGQRVAGPDRYASAIAISRKTFSSAKTVVLAGGANYPDALAAAPLAGVHNAPILLTPPSKVTPALLAEIRRLKASRVIIVGGPVSVSTAVESSLRRAGLSVRRISGANRYEVASRVALEVYSVTDNPEPFVVRGDAFADALSVSSFAYMQKRPVLLCPPSGITPAVASTWARMRAGAQDTVLFVGNSSSITDEMYMGFRKISGPALDQNNVWIWDSRRPDKYGTSAAVTDFFANYYYGLWGGFDFIGLASGDVFADALAGGAAAGYRGGPLVLTQGIRLAPAAQTTLRNHGAHVVDMHAYGGTASLANSALISARASLGTSVYDIDNPSHSVVLGIPTLVPSVTSPYSNDALAAWGRRPEPVVPTEGKLPTEVPQRRTAP